MKIRGQPARSPKGLVVSSPHHVPNLPSSPRSSQHFYIHLCSTSLPNFDPNSHVNHRSAAPIFTHQDRTAVAYNTTRRHTTVHCCVAKKRPEVSPGKQRIIVQIYIVLYCINCAYHRNFIPLMHHKDPNSLLRSLKFRSFFDQKRQILP